MAKIWKQIRSQMKKDNGLQPRDLEKYDREFWSGSLLREKDVYIEMHLGRKYADGTLKGKTVKEYYMEHFDKKYGRTTKGEHTDS